MNVARRQGPSVFESTERLALSVDFPLRKRMGKRQRGIFTFITLSHLQKLGPATKLIPQRISGLFAPIATQ